MAKSGGLIDYDLLKKAGVSAIYRPGTNIPRAAAEILSLIRQQRLAVSSRSGISRRLSLH